MISIELLPQILDEVFLFDLAKVTKLVVLICRWCVGLKKWIRVVCICFIQNCFNIQKLGLTRHTLFPVSPGMCPHFYCGEYSVSIFNSSTSE